MEHTAHHVLPTIPLYHLKDAQKKLNGLLGNSMIQDKFTLTYLFRTMRSCKLYDYESHQWQNYRGEHTTECNLPDRLQEEDAFLDKSDDRHLKYA